MAINIKVPNKSSLQPIITVFGVGGAGGNALNNMISSNLEGIRFIAANTDSQALDLSLAEKKIQLGKKLTQGLGAGSDPLIGASAAEESIDEILQHIADSHLVFVTAGMGGGTGTGAAPIIAKAAKEKGILTIGVITKPFHFEGKHRMKVAESGLLEIKKYVDTLIVIPNQNLFKISDEKTTFSNAFKLADKVLFSGIQGITDLMIRPGLINLDFSDIKAIMNEMGHAVMGSGESEGENRAIKAAEAAIYNPLLAYASMQGAKGVLINITGGEDITLFEVDEAANRVRQEIENEGTNVIFGSTFDDKLNGKIRVSIVATGIDLKPSMSHTVSTPQTTDIKEELPSNYVQPQKQETIAPDNQHWLKRFIKKIVTESKTSQKNTTETQKIFLDDNIYKMPAFIRRKKKETSNDQ